MTDLPSYSALAGRRRGLPRPPDPPSLAQRLTKAAQDIWPETPVFAGSDAWPLRGKGWKRGPMEWAVLLDELAEQLGNGQFYKRDLPLIDEPLNPYC